VSGVQKIKTTREKQGTNRKYKKKTESIINNIKNKTKLFCSYFTVNFSNSFSQYFFSERFLAVLYAAVEHIIKQKQPSVEIIYY